MKFFIVLIVVATTMFSCSQPSNNGETEAATDGTDTLTSDPVEDMTEASGEEPEMSLTIGYDWIDPYRDPPVVFEPFEKIYNDVLVARRLHDSLSYLHQGGPLTSEDSVLLGAALDKAYASILQYQEQVKPGVRIDKGKAPRRVKGLNSGDQSFRVLPESGSRLLNNGDFMFLGGDPFVRQDPEVYKDAAGNPETHYELQESENCTYFFNYIYSRHPGPMDITFGPPLSGYDYDVEVHGIGSITHTLKNRIAVWMLTQEGVFPAQLISVNMKLGDEYGCVSSNPAYVFASAKNVEATSVFGVFFSDQKFPLERAVSMYESSESPLWQYDIDGDGSPDIARVNSIEEGGSGELAVAIWYVKIGDKWEVLDFGRQPDCT